MRCKNILALSLALVVTTSSIGYALEVDNSLESRELTLEETGLPDGLHITSLDGITQGIDSNGNNFKLKEGITVKLEAEQGYISGRTETEFKPDENITRIELAEVIDTIFEFNADNISNRAFYDVANYNTALVNRLSSANILIGTGNNMFSPNEPVTMDQLVIVISRLLVLDDYTTGCEMSINESVWNLDIAEQVCVAGLINGGLYKGNAKITRGEAVHILNKIVYKDLTTDRVNIFSDVSSTTEFAKDIIKAYKN